jgi:hypothetical protein
MRVTWLTLYGLYSLARLETTACAAWIHDIVSRSLSPEFREEKDTFCVAIFSAHMLLNRNITKPGAIHSPLKLEEQDNTALGIVSSYQRVTGDQ